VLSIVADAKDESVDDDDDDDDDDEGFCVIPIPDCFNMDLPPSRTATTSLVVKKSVVLSSQGERRCRRTVFLHACLVNCSSDHVFTIVSLRCDHSKHINSNSLACVTVAFRLMFP